jgi:hypothetical protein
MSRTFAPVSLVATHRSPTTYPYQSLDQQGDEIKLLVLLPSTLSAAPLHYPILTADTPCFVYSTCLGGLYLHRPE